ncbi:hypothetical protein ANN_07428 [Periplaneta americana]|uniref:Uncharacterized protein n=1 Tax=Periplaneta americana TaxID=6978 RepID=A0ABQ8T001_PERAM|nr:hypothetical protein ANN_07428 [Periplaneta americana]
MSLENSMFLHFRRGVLPMCQRSCLAITAFIQKSSGRNVNCLETRTEEHVWTRGLKSVNCQIASTADVMPTTVRRSGISYTKWDHKRNEDVMEELQLEPVINHVKHSQNNWINHLHRMHRDRIPKVMLHYRPNGKRSLGRPKKRWIENSTVRS